MDKNQLARKEFDRTYQALVERSRRGAFGRDPLTLGDLQSGILGEEGLRHAERIRQCLEGLGIPFSPTDEM